MTGFTMMYKGMDGLKRNLLKLWDEFLIVVVGMGSVITDWKRIDHYYFNLFVEAFRLSPYFWGHVAGFYVLYRIVGVIINGI